MTFVRLSQSEQTISAQKIPVHERAGIFYIICFNIRSQLRYHNSSI